ncbi:MAG: universal stress protein [Flavobacteriales bacterium]|nr:universal stress protein [Flavobacteriales bacterium]MBP9080557.1 universal stress protein [Flavobacteriales bacterium]
MNNILCPSDLSATSETGVAYAELVAKRLGGTITLLHAMNRHEKRTDGGELVREELEAQGHSVTQVRVDAQVREGEFMHIIEEASRNGHVLMVCATHGIRGLRQSLFGPDIIKLVRKVGIPSLVVQKQSPRRNDLGTLVMPVAGHERITALLDAVCLLAGKFGSTVHIYQQLRPGEQPSEALERNRQLMVQRLSEAGIPHVVVQEPSNGFSVGFSQPTIAYAQKVGAGCIAIMAVASEEYRYIADAEKERLLTNEPGIPVLCAH